jgi:two-component SAPR family response regulator
MNNQDKKNLDLIIYRLDEQDKKREASTKELEKSIQTIHGLINENQRSLKESLKFIKNNLFDPNGGLWAENKANTNFRYSVTKALWFILPTSIVTALKLFYDGMKAGLK